MGARLIVDNEKPRRIGLNAAGHEVYEVAGIREVWQGGEIVREHDDQQHRRSWFLRAENPNGLMFCAFGLAKAILRGEQFTGAELARLHQDCTATAPIAWRDHLTLPTMLDFVVRRLQSEGASEAIEALQQWTDQISGRVVEAAPILFVGIEGVITSLKTRMFRRTFDPDAIKLIARLAQRLGAKLILTSPMRRTWRAGAQALHQTLMAEGWPNGLWHRQWMLPMIEGGTTWQELDAWFASRDRDALSALIIMQQDDCHLGELPANVGYFDTFAADGFTQWNFFEILDRLGLSDGEVAPPPRRTGSGFRVVPAQWRGREIAWQASAEVTPSRGWER